MQIIRKILNSGKNHQSLIIFHNALFDYEAKYFDFINFPTPPSG